MLDTDAVTGLSVASDLYGQAAAGELSGIAIGYRSIGIENDRVPPME